VRRCEPRGHHAILALYSRQSGVLAAIEGLDQLEARGGVMHLKLGVKPGDRINALETFREKFGLVMLQDETPAGMREKAKWLRENVKLVVQPAAYQARPHFHTATSD